MRKRRKRRSLDSGRAAILLCPVARNHRSANSPRPARSTATPRQNALILVPIALSVVSLFIEASEIESFYLHVFTNVFDFVVLGIFAAELILSFARSPHKPSFFKTNTFNVGFMVVFAALFTHNKVLYFSGVNTAYRALPLNIILIRNLFVLLKVFSRIKRLVAFVTSITSHPARTVILSFALVILTGTVMLSLPFTTVDTRGLDFVDALFTATSAVCVTGLVVVDTAAHFTIWGQLIIVILIQIGGLGIMILSYFAAFVLRRSFTLEDRLLLAYVLSEKDMRGLGRSIKHIIYITFGIEAIGAVLLLFGFKANLGLSARGLFYAVFHAISAFCNAGFALFSDSLVGFGSSAMVGLVVCLLIICGGLSFPVLDELFGYCRRCFRGQAREERVTIKGLSPNTKVVLVCTGILLGGGMLVFYALEHAGVMAELGVGSQYLASFFQSATLRTAGFNTVSFSQLRTPTYLFMTVFMFIGAASGSTAGGIKINSLAVIFAYVSSVLKNRQRPLLFGHSISMDVVLKAFLILLFGVCAVLVASILLSATESAEFVQLLFEAVSAFATVGLSAGITASLSSFGRIMIAALMFMGRVGPLTILVSVIVRTKRIKIEYPQGEILVG